MSTKRSISKLNVILYIIAVIVAFGLFFYEIGKGEDWGAIVMSIFLLLYICGS